MSKDELKFLLSYQPKNDMYTLPEEAEFIIDALGFDQSTPIDVLQAKRNEIVTFYADVMEKEQSDECMSHWIPAMQSITAVIDNLKYNRH